ncbi:LysE family translocator [Robertkochia marina]|uniref:LysE family translocator n=1 Tax=Robertkochia marina TaxID=1227945 RepID=A0A4V3UYD2_9FLAO|nr:LysE family translocator [Robertkochia marina]THD69308.1 LysE family translocator [Robertkochia marina]TRZ47432.1 LysE family translocator [Robertkochia marina]
MLEDIAAAIPLGILLSFTIGPVFFVLLETGALKGFRAAISFDLGVVLGDVVFILIAYFSTNRILERIKDDPSLFIFGGALLITYGIISFIRSRKAYKKELDKDVEEVIKKNNYLNLFLKGFLLNFINVGVLGFWLGIIIIFGPRMEMDENRITVFIATILITYILVDCIKILLAKQLKHRLTPYLIFRIKRMISIILVVFGFFLMFQGLFPNEKEKIKGVIEDIRTN